MCDLGFANGLTGLAWGAEAVNAFYQCLLVLFIGIIRVFHLPEGVAWQLAAVATVGVVPGVDRAVVQGAYAGGHHLHGPEC